jgi:CDP-paratose 2-epimerase
MSEARRLQTRFALVTGSGGLVGSHASRMLATLGYTVIGVDNDMRAYFFGKDASTAWNSRSLKDDLGKAYVHYSVDIRDAKTVDDLFARYPFEIIIHTAAQPSHDWAARDPITDFSINALSTLLLLEACRKHCPAATFIFTSTNKVYGDNPNRLPLVEQSTRYEIEPDHEYRNGINETMSLDQCTHSVFGASKVAADIIVQEYGRYFNLNTGVFRCGCLTGGAHAGAEMHGFLAYLVRCVSTGSLYSIFGYKGKQVRDNIHASDLVEMFRHFHENPRPGEVYNAGGGRSSSISVLEALDATSAALGKKAHYQYCENSRTGDHIWYISDCRKFEAHYPGWKATVGLGDIIADLCRSQRS